jgi:hypothetical protein|tara:strand:- start:463 stop:627 length:165 start_codon:yes stop_codon:yes gene_type:complete
MLSNSMFVIGFVIFSLYLFGLLYMVNWGHKSQEKDESHDPEIKISKNHKKPNSL